jgi:hypothetical protein
VSAVWTALLESPVASAIVPHTGADVAPFISCGQPVKVQVNHKRGRLLIVPDQIAHQHIQHVIVNGNGTFETRHKARMKEEVRRKK